MIIGGALQARSDATIKELRDIQDRFPKLEGADMVAGAWMNVVPRQLARSWTPEPRTDWHIGDLWQLYPGAGAPATLLIEKMVILGHPGDSFREGAIARFVSRETANRIEGLRASEYLAAPGAGIANVSQTPLVPISEFDDAQPKTRLALFERARKIVQGEDFGIDPNPNASQEERARVRKLNRGFLDTRDVDVRTFRWSLPGQPPLLFALAIWYSRVDEEPLPVFAAEAILEEGQSLRLLAFDEHEGGWMRMGEFRSWKWTFDHLSRFLNAWKIGNRYFVLRQLNGYESSGIELQEIDPKAGLVQTDLSFDFGL